MPRVVRLWTSAAPGEGRGHLARALALAEATWPDDVTVELALARGEPSPAEHGRAVAARVRIVDAAEPRPGDAAVVVDAPDPTAIVRDIPRDRLVVFDDRETFDGVAALIVQPSLPTWSGVARAGRVLAGYRWAPIGSAWRAAIAGGRQVHDDGRPRVLVCFGGSDPHDVTGRLGPALEDERGWTTTIVVGTDYHGRADAGGPVVREPPDLPTRVANTDLVVTGAGTMKFEVAALGRPAILLAVADDQLPVGPPFAEAGAARWLGDGRTADPEAVRAAVAALLDDDPARSAMAMTARGLVDGRGADRLAAEISALTGSPQTSAS
jgi:UDP-2,4-diacetamido-2,4,6-trideoxy-beta-L-altropyranose hydrolase